MSSPRTKKELFFLSSPRAFVILILNSNNGQTESDNMLINYVNTIDAQVVVIVIE